jgi:hypothetical protein
MRISKSVHWMAEHLLELVFALLDLVPLRSDREHPEHRVSHGVGTDFNETIFGQLQ